MSASAQEIDGEGDDAVRNGDDEDVGFDNPRKKKRRRKRSYLEFLGKLARARKVFLCHSILRRSKRKPIRSVDEGARCGQRWLFCISRPGTSDSPVESYPSDPNDPTHEKVRNLLERNDFYSKECNPHLNVDSLASCVQ